MITRTRKDPARFRCSFPNCEAKFTRKANLDDHFTSHRREDAVSFKCSRCSQNFLRKGDRDRHHRLQHQEKPKFVCGLLPEHLNFGCARRFKRRDALLEHRRARDGRCTHTPLNPIVQRAIQSTEERQGAHADTVQDTSTSIQEAMDGLLQLSKTKSKEVTEPAQKETDEYLHLRERAALLERILLEKGNFE